MIFMSKNKVMSSNLCDFEFDVNPRNWLYKMSMLYESKNFTIKVLDAGEFNEMIKNNVISTYIVLYLICL